MPAPPAMPAARARQPAGYAAIAAKHNASASAPLHASVTSTGLEGGPSSADPAAPCHRVNGRRTCAATHGSLNTANIASDQATSPSGNLYGLAAARTVSVGTGDLLDR
jgi:hypothetical protein